MAYQIMASHILILHKDAHETEATRTRDEALAVVRDLQKKLADGGDFAELARRQSECPSAGQGGALGMFSRGEMVPAFDSAAFGLKMGEVSDVVETEFGYHLIKRTA